MRNKKIAVVGLGYVGLPVAVLFASKYEVIGYDVNPKRTDSINNYKDETLEIKSKKLKNVLSKNLTVSNEIKSISDCNIYIITVPTPINDDKSPDLSMILEATELVGNFISKGDIIIYESTVYPGCTQEKCIPILEKISGLKFNKEFYCGYSHSHRSFGEQYQKPPFG